MKIILQSLVCILILFATTSICNAQTSTLQLTDEEKAFIEAHPVINLAIDPELVPYGFIDSDGQFKGIAADYIALLSEKIGIEMVPAENLTWSRAYELAVEKKLDVLPCVAKTSEREKYFLFSNAYFEFQRVVVVKDTDNSIKNFADLLYSKVAVQINSAHYSYLKSYPQIEISPYPTVEEGLAAVSDGTETAFVGNLATSSYLIKKGGYTNLKYVIINAQEVQSLHFAVRNDWPELVGILNKALASITKEEKIAIQNKWLGVVNEIDYGPIIVIVLIILLTLSVSLFWVIRLKKEVAKRRRVEEQLKKAKVEAETANQIKSSFLARMSHEIRTPLNAITGMAYLIKKTDTTVTQKMYLEKITQASYNMLGIINDILDFSKIESGRIEIERIPFNLDKVLQQVVSIVSFKIEEQGVKFSMNRSPEIPNSFFGDPKRIAQILINIINNAVKFTSEGEVSFEIRSIPNNEGLCTLEFSIVDTGVGMSEDQQSQLFTPFVQADASINRRFGGTGLGLSIVKSLTELMSGTVTVDSTLGAGSRFTIHLPLEVDKVTEDEAKQSTVDFYFQDVKTIVFEKNEVNSKLLQIYLQSFGMVATFIETETELKKMFTPAEIKNGFTSSLLILDYESLPEDRLEFIRKLRSNPNINPELKIIMLIPFMREDVFEEIEGYDIDLGIIKPVIPSVLYNGILEIFRKETIALQEKKSQAMSNELESRSNTNHILVVEDNKTNQFIAKSILQQAGYIVALADNGEEGVAHYLAHQSEIDLILMDLHMPVLNGYEASMQIRKLNTSIPIVAMTADAITGVEDECKRAGIDHYISKPFEPEALLRTLSDILKWKLNEPEVILDEEDGLMRLGNDEAIYEMILNEYLKENQDVASELDQAIDLQNYGEAIRIVHKNKSGSGNIGAKKLYSIASELQNALENRSEADIERLHHEFSNLLIQLLKQIEMKSTN